MERIKRIIKSDGFTQLYRLFIRYSKVSAIPSFVDFKMLVEMQSIPTESIITNIIFKKMNLVLILILHVTEPTASKCSLIELLEIVEK